MVVGSASTSTQLTISLGSIPIPSSLKKKKKPQLLIRKNPSPAKTIAVLNRSNKGGVGSHKKMNNNKMKTDSKNTTRDLKNSNLTGLQFLNQHGSVQSFTQYFGPLECKVLKRFVLAMGDKENIADVDMKLVDKNLLHKVCVIFEISLF